LDTDTLIFIYQHCASLNYQSLVRRVRGRLRRKFYEALPIIEEIKFYQSSIPALYEFAIRCLSNEMVNPWAHTYVYYYVLAESNALFGYDLGKAMRELLDARIKRAEEHYRITKDRQVRWAIKYIDSVLAGRCPGAANKPAKHSKTEAPSLFSKSKFVANEAQVAQPVAMVPAPKVKTSAVCYTGGEKGHLARNCTVEIKDLVERPQPEC
jgi:hypothetical protein